VKWTFTLYICFVTVMVESQRNCTLSFFYIFYVVYRSFDVVPRFWCQEHIDALQVQTTKIFVNFSILIVLTFFVYRCIFMPHVIISFWWMWGLLLLSNEWMVEATVFDAMPTSKFNWKICAKYSWCCALKEYLYW